MVSEIVTERMGIFKRYSDVPERYRLGRFEPSFVGRDAFANWEDEEITSKWQREESSRVEARWKTHMAARDRHHALATPADVDVFVEELTSELQMERVYKPYWLFLKRFYEWMKWHTDYPHRYNPVLMACVEYPASQAVWSYVMNDVKEQFG